MKVEAEAIMRRGTPRAPRSGTGEGGEEVWPGRHLIWTLPPDPRGKRILLFSATPLAVVCYNRELTESRPRWGGRRGSHRMEAAPCREPGSLKDRVEDPHPLITLAADSCA